MDIMGIFSAMTSSILRKHRRGKKRLFLSFYQLDLSPHWARWWGEKSLLQPGPQKTVITLQQLWAEQLWAGLVWSVLWLYLVIAPEPGQAVGVYDAEDFALGVLPADEVLVPAVWQELVDVVPQQPAVWTKHTKRQTHKVTPGSCSFFYWADSTGCFTDFTYINMSG